MLVRVQANLLLDLPIEKLEDIGEESMSLNESDKLIEDAIINDNRVISVNNIFVEASSI